MDRLIIAIALCVIAITAILTAPFWMGWISGKGR